MADPEASGPTPDDRLVAADADAVEATRVDARRDETGAPRRETPGLPIPDDYQAIKLPGYELLSLLGRGGMGVVFLARQERLDRLVAIKMLSRQMSQDSEYVQRLRREAVTLGNLNHPNIVGCHDVIVHEGQTYFVMEYVPGKTNVRDLIRRYGQLSEVTSLRILLQAARGLAYAHEKGIIHRDVKPENLQVFTDLDATADGPDVLVAAAETRVMLLDFGLAKGVAGRQVGHDVEITGRGFVVGSPSYMAPEQAVADPVDFRADIYALGASLYHMLTGITPFASDSPMQSLNRKLAQDLPNPTESGVEVTDECVALLRDMASRDLDKRPASYRELIERIEDVLALHGGAPRPKPAANPSRLRRRVAIVLLVLGLLGGLAAGGVYLRRPAPSLTTQPELWTVNGDAWQFAEPDEESVGQIALIGGGRDAIATLDMPITPGTRIELDMRIPGTGSVAIGLGTPQHDVWRLAFARTAQGETYSLTVDGMPASLPALRPRENWQWRHLEISVYADSILFYVDGDLSGNQPLQDSPETYRLIFEAMDTRIVQFAEVRLSELPAD